MRGWLPILVLGASLAASTLPAAAGDIPSHIGPSRIWVDTYPPGSGDSVGADLPRDGSSTPRPSGPTVEQAADGVSVVRGGYTPPLTVEEAADGVSVVRGPGLHH